MKTKIIKIAIAIVIFIGVGAIGYGVYTDIQESKNCPPLTQEQIQELAKYNEKSK